MNFGWETEKERILRFMKISPKKKLEWLNEMHEFIFKATTKKDRLLRQKLRESYYRRGA